MSINKVRSLLYRLGRLLGDVSAVEKGKVPQRVERRIAGSGSCSDRLALWRV
jgi:hypothetical protein